MTINVNNEEGKLTLVLEGTLDSMTSGALEESLAENLTDEVRELVLDFSKVEYISSKGLRVLVATLKKMHGRPMRLENINDNVREVLRLSGLLKVFTA